MTIRILVVDDDPLQLAVLAQFLESHQYFVEVAHDGMEAVRKARAGWFDVVLMDYQIPELDGLAAARLIAGFTAAVGRPRLIALSVAPEQLQAREARSPLIFDAIECKPWNPEALLATIARCCAAVPSRNYRWALENSLLAPPASHGGAADAPNAPSVMDPEVTRVLVVEDDDLLLAILKMSLEGAGYEVHTATNGFDALARLAVCRYDIVVSDYQMPDLDGLATAKLIFELHARSDRPRLIALTSLPEQLSEREGGGLSVFDEIVPKALGIQPVLAAAQRCADYKRRRSDSEPIPIMRLASHLQVMN